MSEVKFYVGQEVLSRDGNRKGRIICIDAPGDYPLVAIMDPLHWQKSVTTWLRPSNGIHPHYPNGSLDLVPIPVETRGYQIIYDTGIIGNTEFPDKKSAVGCDPHQLIEKTYTDGKFLSARIIPVEDI